MLQWHASGPGSSPATSKRTAPQRQDPRCMAISLPETRKGYASPMWKRVALYGLLLAAGTLALQWLDYQRLARVHSGDVYTFLVALGFLALGLAVGARAFRAPAPEPFDGNPKAQAALGISARELDVLRALAEG